MYTTTLTSQGTVTLPAALRSKYNLAPGDTLVVSDNGNIIISKPLTFAQIRARNKAHLGPSANSPVSYKSGDGFTAHVQEKYGKK